MKESTWEECLEFNSALTVSQDKAKAKSLLNTAQERLKFLDTNKINDHSINFIFEGYYSSVLEILHALLLLNGYKVNNHICLGYYIRDVVKKNDLFRMYDDCRFKRNSLIYYGKKMDFATAKEALEKCKKLILELELLLNERLLKNEKKY